MQTTKLETIGQVTEAMRPLFDVTAAQLRALTPGQRRQRAARLADLYEIRAQLFAEIPVRRVAVAESWETVALATARAAQADRDAMRFWRHEAGAR